MLAGDLFVLRNRGARQCLVHVLCGVAETNLPHDPMRKTQLAVRACANAQVITELPVVELVLAAMTGFRERGNLVALQSDLRGSVWDEVQPVRRGGVVR